MTKPIRPSERLEHVKNRALIEGVHERLNEIEEKMDSILQGRQPYYSPYPPHYYRPPPRWGYPPYVVPGDCHYTWDNHTDKYPKGG